MVQPGKVQAKLENYAGVIESYKRHLVLAPSAPDASEIGDEIIKLEFRQERSATIRSRAGKKTSLTDRAALTIVPVQ